MKSLDQFLKSLFPLPRPIQQLLQAQAFLLLSPKGNTTNNYRTQMRFIEYDTEKQTQQNQVKYLSLSNLFHLTIKNSQIKYLNDKNKWCLIIQMESPSMSLKQKINMNINTRTQFTENQLTLILHSMNALLQKYSSSPKIKYNQLLDHIFITNKQLVKLAVPSLMYPLKILSKNTEQKMPRQNYNFYKFAAVFIQILTLTPSENIKTIKQLQQKLTSLHFQSFAMNQFKLYLFEQLKLGFSNKTTKQSVNLKSTQEPDINVSMQNIFPNLRVINSSQVIKSNQSHISSPKQTPIKSLHLQGQDSKDFSNNKLKLKFLTLNQIAEDKVVQSFQEDEYSYIVESNNNSPCRISPHKGFPPLQYSKVSYEANLSKLSPVISEKIQQQLSNSFEIQVQKSQQNPKQKQNLQNSNSSAVQMKNTTNSMILQVQQEYGIVEGSSVRSDTIQLSFSQNNDDTVQIQEIQDQNNGTRYYGQTMNGIKEGKGKMFYPDGGYYEGEWKNNQIFGFGRLFYPSNKLAYAGYWKNGCFHGPGLVLNEEIEEIQTFDYTDFSNLGRTWISYRGNFNMDIREGLGVVKISNGDTITGIWQNNCLNGEAEYKKQDGSIIKGIWKMNKLQKILPKQIKN